MLKIFYDHQIFSEQAYGGISRYFKYLIDGIKDTSDIDYKLGVLKSNNYYIREEKQLLGKAIFNPLFKTQQKLVKWNNSYCKYLLKKNDFSIFHPTYFHPYFLKHLKKPLVITVHDMTYEALPQFFNSEDPLPYYKRLLMQKADKIIAISENTKMDILKYSKIKEDKIEVIHHGIDLRPSTYVSIDNLPENYILFVGSRWTYKNFHTVALAYKSLLEKFPNMKLILAGGGPLTYGDSEFLLRNDILDKTIQISVSDEQLNTLYKNAICFIYPSLYEGFGLPILEAFKNNCPVILSNCSCFPEIAGDAAIYFDAESVSSLSSKIYQIMENEALRVQLVNAGSHKLKTYTLEKCTAETINVYKELTNQP
jgi:glycosyltransferase involved in cell wall biosynthesis